VVFPAVLCRRVLDCSGNTREQQLHHILSIVSQFAHSNNFRLLYGSFEPFESIHQLHISQTHILLCTLTAYRWCNIVRPQHHANHVQSNALQWVLVSCAIGCGDSYFKASFYTVLSCILYQKVTQVFFWYFRKCHRELVAGWLALCG